MTHIVTREKLQEMLNAADPVKRMHIVGRALVVIFRNQTQFERDANTTNVDNGVGFTGADGRGGALAAKSYLKRGTLQEWQVERWMRPGKSGFSRITKHWKQLDVAAHAKKVA